MISDGLCLTGFAQSLTFIALDKEWLRCGFTESLLGSAELLLQNQFSEYFGMGNRGALSLWLCF